MKTRNILMILMLIPLLSSAAERSEQQMQQAAMRVLNSSGTYGNKAPRKSTELKLMKKMPKLSVYGYEGGGFAVVSSDDRFNDVIGYSQTEYQDTVMPCGFRWWLNTANDVMETTDSQDVAPFRVRKANVKASVEPILSTKWGQSNPFNALLHYSIKGVSVEFVTGCVATAMAQVMKHYEYPDKAQDSVSYVVWHYLANMKHTFGDYYDWDNMLDVYNYMEWGSMRAETKAVATLMRDCGMAVEMNYGTASIGSGTNSAKIAPALKKYFSYSDRTTLYKREDYSKADWMQMIYEELSNNRPIIYNGIDKRDEENPSGHSFVLHGYDASGAVYVNWGWEGAYDGYYDIDLLNPDTYQYSEEQDMVFVVPGNGENENHDNPDNTTNTLYVNDVKISPDDSRPLTVGLKNQTTNLMGWQCDIELPDGLTLEVKANGKPAATLGERFATTEHSISSSRLANGAYRFVATSMDGEAISGTSGTLFTVTLQADAALTERAGTGPAPTLTGKVTNIEFNTQDNQKVTLDDVAFSVTITKPELPKCAMPTIAYDHGELVFTCKTEGVTFVSEVTTNSAKGSEGERIKLAAPVYVITVVAKKEGYDDSEAATATIQWGDGRPVFTGFTSVAIDTKGGSDVNGDGTVDVADIATIISEMAARTRKQDE